MESKVKILGHPIHPILIVFPLGLLATAVIFDILNLIAPNDAFPTVSFWLITAGVVGGLLAAIFGFLDWLAVTRETRAKSVGLWHGIGNVVVVLLFALSWLLRRGEPGTAPTTLAFVLSLLGAALALVTAWLGGEMVYRLRVGVDRGAHLDAPSSLSDEPAAPAEQRAMP
ncbi:MAG: DUF2231 domain-containing protein [Candidatus Promineifilaceae bacterium]